VLPLKDECGICKRVFSYNRLKRCERCKKLFCYDCMVPDVATGDRTRMLCLNCARRVVSPKGTSKYEGITRHLKFRASFTSLVKLTFARIDGLIGDNLPMAAYRNESWWTNSASNMHAKSWLDAGWEVQEIHLSEGFVIFKKVVQTPRTRTRRKKTTNEITKPFTPVPVRSSKPKLPSKTKVSKLYARILNLERQRSSSHGFSKGFKPKSTYEKRLFGSDEKPQ
jgi:hypothetical protein